MENIDTRGMGRNEWLAARRIGIGGSDAAAIVGMDPYSSAYEVWADKLGLLPPKPDSEAMRQGRDFEDYVASRFAEGTGHRVRRVNEIIRSEQYPWAIANVDRKVVGLDEGLECKTTSVLSLKRFKGGEFPGQYYVQCMHYMAVTGWSAMWLAALVLNKDFFVYRIERDDNEIAALMEAERQFWDGHVIPAIAPAPDGSKSAGNAINLRFPEADVNLEADLSLYRGTLQELAAAKARKKEAEGEEERLRQIIMGQMGGAAYGFADGFKVSWPTQVKRTLDQKKLQEAHPGLDLSPYMRATSFRKFDFREVP
jgi:putative phage-type endonuclease